MSNILGVDAESGRQKKKRKNPHKTYDMYSVYIFQVLYSIYSLLDSAQKEVLHQERRYLGTSFLYNYRLKKNL